MDFPASCHALRVAECHSPVVSFKALLVDDDVRFLMAAGKLLAQEGVQVVGVAANGDEAIQQAQRLQPDVALVDIDLHGESGFDVAARFAELAGGGQPVIMISSYAEKDFRDLIAASTALGFVSKADLSARAIEELLDAVDGRTP